MKTFILLLAGLLIAGTTTAQNHFELETDPLAWSLGGGSLHAAYTWKNERVQLGAAFLPLPEGFQQHEGVSESFEAISFKWDYFFGRETADKGFFAGPTIDYLAFDYEDEAGASTDRNTMNLGLRAGYRFDLFAQSKSLNGLYLTPWAGLSYMTNSKSIVLSDVTYDLNPVQFFPTVHLGWSF